MNQNTQTPPSNFIRNTIAEDIRNGKNQGKVHTRFPPEPNGYLHIGHAKAIWINYGMALEFNGKFNLRFDDTNPAKEEQEYVDSIKNDIHWLGCDWEERLFFASDYFDQMYEYAIALIQKGKAYVDDQTADQIRKTRGTLTQPGKESPYRNRSPQENMALFEQMKNGEFPDGSKVLRAKIDMASPNLNLRDPVMYRILKATHHRTGDKWNIYPMYDWAHGLEDSIEGITHSLCSLEFEDHRPLYNWFLDQLNVHHPQQIEFARLNLTYTVMSKRKLIELVQQKLVNGWDDPRMPTISGMRRRGYPPQAIRDFCERIGVAKRDSMVDLALLEFSVREYLNKHAPRYMGVLNPLKVVIENYPEGQVEELEAANNPEKPEAGKRNVPFSKELYIEQEDFMEDPPKKFFRLAPGREVRLRYAYYVTYKDVIKDSKGKITELRCTYDPATRGGDSPDGRKVKATLHWVSAKHAVPAEIRLYDTLFTKEDMNSLDKGKNYQDYLNPNSLQILSGSMIEPGLSGAQPGTQLQFERQGYFCVDPDSSKQKLVFNRTITLKDTWTKIVKAGKTNT